MFTLGYKFKKTMIANKKKKPYRHDEIVLFFLETRIVLYFDCLKLCKNNENKKVFKKNHNKLVKDLDSQVKCNFDTICRPNFSLCFNCLRKTCNFNPPKIRSTISNAAYIRPTTKRARTLCSEFKNYLYNNINVSKLVVQVITISRLSVLSE